MYTRFRHAHDPIPSISNIPKPSDLPNWCTSPENLMHPDHYPLPPFPPPPIHNYPAAVPKTEIKEEGLVHATNARHIAPSMPNPHRTPHLPAEKNSAVRAAKIAAECEDLGPDACQRFKCRFQGCNKYFQRRYNLKVHVRKHTKETPYTCPQPACGKKFMWRSSISHHLKAHKKRAKVMSQSSSASLPSRGGAYAPLATATHTTSTGHRGNGEYVAGAKVEDRIRRVHGRLLPTSPVSSGTNERFGSFALDDMGVGGVSDAALEELNFHGEHVTGLMFDNMM